MKSLLVLFSLLFSASSFAELVVYTDRNPDWFQTAKSAYEAKTGDQVIFVVVGAKEMAQRLVNEGEAIPKDLIISKDLSYVTPIVNRGLVQPLPSIQAFEYIPAGMISESQEWAAFTFRARAAVYNTQVNTASDFSTYYDLARPQWQGKLCLRDGSHDYNIALTASMVLKNGAPWTLDMLVGWMENLAAPAFQKDSHVIAAVADQTCGVGIVNHYYVAQEIAKAQAENRELPVAFKFLNQGDGGTHTNGTSVMMSATSDQHDAVQAFLEELYADESLLAISAAHYDFPASTRLLPNTFVGTWGPNGDGTFEKQDLNWLHIGEKRDDAADIMEIVGWN